MITKYKNIDLALSDFKFIRYTEWIDGDLNIIVGNVLMISDFVNLLNIMKDKNFYPYKIYDVDYDSGYKIGITFKEVKK